MSPTSRSYEIRPRLVWGGLAVAILGMVVLALGLMVSSAVWLVIGAVLLAAGVVVGVRGGGLHDTHRPGLMTEEARAVVHGSTRRTVRHEEVPARLEEESSDADRTRRALLTATARTPVTPLAPLAALVLAGDGILLLAAQAPLYPMSHTGQLGSLRALGTGVVLTLGGLRVVFGAPGRHLVAAGLSLVVSLVLLAGGIFLAHQSASAPFVESIAGAVGALAAAVCLASPLQKDRSASDR
ncbi:MAG TPA: hypothetical protein VHO29_08395 [Marmoricola sp.]|nr:hypothetical protein [Marmoricola sp.]